MKRWNRVIKLLRMEGSVTKRIGTGVVIVVGFYAGLWFGRLLLTI